MFLADRLELDASPRRTKDGYLAVRARVARTGVYDYAGREVDPNNEHGLRDKAVVKVLRDEQTVFDKAAVHSFIGKPITNDHPSQPVNSKNWKDLARGTIMGALRDGEYVAFDLLLTDQAAIDAVDGGKRDLSNGYGVDLEYGQFTASDGTVCDARQAKITGGNHVALVDRGRAGSECAIKDGIAVCDAISADQLAELKASIQDERTGSMPHVLTVDGLQVPNVSDEAKACIEKLQGVIATRDTTITDLNGKVSTLTGEKTALETQVADAKAASDPAKLDALAADRAALVALAKGVFPAVVTDGKSAAEIRKAVVDHKLGDKAPTVDAEINGAFSVLTADVKTTDGDKVVNINPAPQVANDSGAAVRDLARANQY